MTAGEVFVPQTFPVPQGFVPTAPTSQRWHGKVRCAFCDSTGWPMGDDSNSHWWGHRHGFNCAAARR